MQISGVTVSVDKLDAPSFVGPRPYNPTGWLGIGFQMNIVPPRKPRDAIVWLAQLEQAAHDLRDLLENKAPDADTKSE